MVIVSNVAVDRQNSVASLFDCLLEKLRLCFLNQSRNFYINVSLGFFISTSRKKLGYVGIDHGFGLDDGCPWQGRKSGGDDLLSESPPEPDLSPGLGALVPSLDTLIVRGIGTEISCPSKDTTIVSPPPLPAGTVATYSRTVGSNLGGRTTPGRGGAYAPLSLPLDEYLE
eukprot:CAMPEP_0116138022 /NCGR_PEP_ID=MMETSP0329-20121206/12552_1 /TAXON_ID=697910 /ORGANISM="Pseudo-nitzschia arenysensis, Strain B593" /LENGTH=169 /DNA_ID=CAMNT_0003632961 /DNA_START=354 /DNA_END=864 /DNA_ORIENTATION=-